MPDDIQKSYGIDEETDLWDICREVCICLGNGVNGSADKLLYEIMGVETGHGKVKDGTKGSAGNGICQFDKLPFEDNRSRYKNSHIQKVIDHFGIDMIETEWEDLEKDVLKSIIACRLHFKPFKEEIPKDIIGRARYWKRLYNTKEGKGTVKHYLKMNGYDMEYYHHSMEVI